MSSIVLCILVVYVPIGFMYFRFVCHYRLECIFGSNVFMSWNFCLCFISFFWFS